VADQEEEGARAAPAALSGDSAGDAALGGASARGRGDGALAFGIAVQAASFKSRVAGADDAGLRAI